MSKNFFFKELSHKLLGMAFTIHNILGPGLLESAYEGAFIIELKQAGISYEQQKVYPLYYKGELSSAYVADLVVDNSIILELKSVSCLNRVMEAQLLNYLQLSGRRVGYTLKGTMPDELSWYVSTVEAQGPLTDLTGCSLRGTAGFSHITENTF